MMRFFRSINPEKVPGRQDSADEFGVLKERILQYFLLMIAGGSVILFILALPTLLQSGRIPAILILSFTVVLLVSLAVFRQIPYKIRAIVFAAIFYLIATGTLYLNGLEGGGPILMTGFFFLTALLLGPRFGFAGSALALVTMVSIGYLIANKIFIPEPIVFQASTEVFREWIIRAVTLTAISILFVFALMSLVGGLNKTILSQKKLTQEIKSERDSLEERVQQGTTALEKRALELETASHMARDISTISDLDQLLTSAVNLLKDEFGFYYVAVFLTDEHKEFAVLQSGTGEAGKMLLEQRHRHPLTQTSMVGYAISNKEIRLSQNVNKDSVHSQNPLLPETRSEIAVPLIVNGEAIGALDVQSTQADFFQPDDIRVLQVAVDQLAVAFEKAHLVQQLTQTLEDLKTSYRQGTQQSWQNFMKLTRREYAYQLQDGRLEPGNSRTALASQALKTGKVVMSTLPAAAGERPKTDVAIPIKLRDQVLGVLDLQFEVGLLPAQSIELLEAAANRLALALDNARLMEEVQIRASREKMVSEISAKVRAESDVERVLQTVALELGHSLGVSGVLVQLRGPE